MAFTKITNAGFGLTTGTLVGVAASFSSTVSVGGTLTYEDVTNVDSVGLITARNGIEVTDKGVQVGTGATVDSAGDNILTFLTNGSERIRVDSSGRLLIATSASQGKWNNSSGDDHIVQIESTSAFSQSWISHSTSSTAGVQLDIGRSRGSGDGDTTVVNDGDLLGHLCFQGADGSQFVRGARISAVVNGTPTADDMPTDLVFETNSGGSNSSERLRIDNSGRLLIGATTVHGNQSDADLLIVGSTTQGEIYLSRGATPANSGSGLGFINFTGGNGIDSALISSFSDGGTWTNGSSHPSSLRFSTTADGASSVTERMRIQSDGKVLIGHTSNIFSYKLAVFGTDGGNSGISASRFSNNASPSSLILSKSRGTSIGSYTIVQDDDEVGMIDFRASDGTDNNSQVARIKAEIDGTPGSNDMPGRLTFHTTADGAASTTERLRIDSSGNMGLGGEAVPTISGYDTATMHLRQTGSSSRGSQLRMTNGASGHTASDGMYLAFWSDNNIYFYNRESGKISFGTSDSERMVLASSGNLGIGAASPAAKLDVAGNQLFSAANPQIQFNAGGPIIRLPSANTLAFLTDSTNERMRIDDAGRVLVGTNTQRTMGGHGAALQVSGTNYGSATVNITNNANSSNGAYLFFSKQRSGSAGGNTILQNGDLVGQIRWLGADGTDLDTSLATIDVLVDNTPGSNDMPGRMTFSTTANGASSPTERLRISNVGKFTASTIYSLTTTGGGPVYVESDGDLLRYTSSLKYKTDVETIEDARADAILNCRPVWYRSKCTNDVKTEGSEKSDWGWYGFIAEEVAEIEPRLVNWATKDAVTQEDGSNKTVERDPADYEAEGVRYDNFVPLLVNLVKRQKAQIDALEARISAIEG